MSDNLQLRFLNQLLRALPPEELALLRPHLEPTSLTRGQVVLEPGAPILWATFPEGGVVSLVTTTSDGRRLEVGLFGRDGMCSTALVLGADRTPLEAQVQLDGSGHRVGAEALREVLARAPSLRSVLLRYAQAFTVQVAQTALSNGGYTIEERLARWLLMTHDRVDGNELPLTHEFMATMLGVRRPGVTVATHVLEGMGAIRTKRGLIVVRDRAKLEELAGDGYGPAEREYERLIGKLRDPPAPR